MTRAVVFGAGGFVGGWVCEELAIERGFDVLCCVRSWASSQRVARRGLRLTQCALEDTAKLASVVAGANVVINAAMPAPASEVDLSVGLYRAAAASGVKRFIQFSSAAVYGNATGILDEDTAPEPDSDYGRGKMAMERRLLEISSSGPQLFILRPSIVYGPFSESWTVQYARRIVGGRWRHLGRWGTGTCNLVHAQDLARLVAAAATVPVPNKAHVLIANGPDVVSWNDYIERFGDELDVPNRGVPNAASFMGRTLATEFLRFGSHVAKARAANLITSLSTGSGAGHAFVGGVKSLARLYPPFDEVRLLTQKVRYSAERCAREIGFRPSIGLDEGLRTTAEWCRRHGIV